jgi:putative PIN family toxin of toxin-antitoxin system
MIRAVLDTSVLVSALITPGGSPGGVLDAAERGDFTLCLSPQILAETLDVLTRDARQERYRFDAAVAEGFCDGLLQTAELLTDLPELAGVTADPKDDVIVATAVAAKADYLVTGDRKHLLPLGAYEGIRIVTPAAFLAELGRPAAPSTSPT